MIVGVHLIGFVMMHMQEYKTKDMRILIDSN